VSGQITCLRWSRIAGRLLRQAWKSVLATRGTVAKRFRRDHFLLDEGSANARRRPEVTRANTLRGLHWYKREFVSARGASGFSRKRNQNQRSRCAEISFCFVTGARAPESFLDGFGAYVTCQYEISRSIVHGMLSGILVRTEISHDYNLPSKIRSFLFSFFLSFFFLFLRCIELSLACFNFVLSRSQYL